jgi:hypothetical protein
MKTIILAITFLFISAFTPEMTRSAPRGSPGHELQKPEPPPTPKKTKKPPKPKGAKKTKEPKPAKKPKPPPKPPWAK